MKMIHKNKDDFWEQLTNATEEAKGNIYITGDLNGRVGKRDGHYNRAIGNYGEDIRNNNRKRILEFCTLHNIIVSNTFYKYKDIYKYIREVKTRNERSIIDYILDTKVRRGYEIGSDHYLVFPK